MPVIINELAATIRPEPQTVARDVTTRPATAEAAVERVHRDMSISKEREARLAVD